ncbi:hypothetical protein F4824DRAFT_440277 [Ustulina deusta]|nr:hypothetical protein F4824DRAFT_440277 [Ustulina deusta]
MPSIHRQQDRGRTCGALREDGSECREKLLQTKYTLCKHHHQEHKQLYESYKLQERYYNSISTNEGGADIKESLETKLAAGKQVLHLRDQVNRRFFNLSAQNRGHIQWILRLQSKLRHLEQQLEALRVADATSSTARNHQHARTRDLGSPLDPTMLVSTRSHLRLDSPVTVVRQTEDEILARTIDQLYSISPSLDDSSSTVYDEKTQEMREPDVRDFVIRFLFRGYLLCQANADMLTRARQAENINFFLRGSSVQFLEDCLKFFKAFYEGRDCKLYLLRNAVSDYLLEPQSSFMTIFGARISTDNSTGRMTARGWDILWEHFRDIVGWRKLHSLAYQFEDVVRVKTLIECGRYGSGDDNADGLPSWQVPDQDVAQENALAVLHGFIAVKKDSFDPGKSSSKTRHGIVEETETRSYLVGRMSKQNPWAHRLARELSERIVNLQTLVYDREEVAETTPFIPLSSKDENPWITRTRSALTKEALSSQEWTIESSLESLLDDLELMHDLTNRTMATDYYEFILIGRTPNRAFDLLDVVVDALSKLRGGMSYAEILGEAIEKYIPFVEQVKYLEEASGKPTFDYVIPPAAFHWYRGNRVRSWDVSNSLNGILRAAQRNPSRKTPPSESRLISRISADLESRGVITRILDYEPPCTEPIIIQGVDRHDDLYFYYDLGPLDEQAIRGSALDVKPSKNNLLKFCDDYKLKHPSAVFAKGSIHVHYCAWPIPMPQGPKYARLNFSTPEGRLYRWKALPFDMPLALHIWQFWVDRIINSNLLFVRLVQTTLVICAEDLDSADANLKTLTDLGENHGWSFSIPSPSSWITNARNLGLGFLQRGVQPAL